MATCVKNVALFCILAAVKTMKKLAIVRLVFFIGFNTNLITILSTHDTNK